MLSRDFFSRFKKKETKTQELHEGDILELLSKNKQYFAGIEAERSGKTTHEVLQEIQLGLAISETNLIAEFQIFNGTPLIFIPPKYEFWAYFLIALNLVQLGYEVKFLFHNWSKTIIDTIQPNLNYLKYQALKFENVDDFDFIAHKDAQVLNFSEHIKGVPDTVATFSTALVTKDCDLDYVFAYILASTFAFAGLKKSSLKRIIVDTAIEKQFSVKLANRIISIDIKNNSRIRSQKLRQQIHELISDGISEGADLVLGASDFEHDEYENVIITNVLKEMRIFQKKFYGPVLLFSFVDFSNTQELDQYVNQQPSKGIVIFSDSERCEQDMVQRNGTRIDFVTRPLEKNTEYGEILEHYPSLEILLRFLRKNKS